MERHGSTQLHFLTYSGTKDFVHFVCHPLCTVEFNRTAGKMREVSDETLGRASCCCCGWKTPMKWRSLFPAAVPTQNTETGTHENLDMWVHFSVRGSAELQPKLLFIYPVWQRRETKGLCFPADVGDRRSAMLQFWQRGFFKRSSNRWKTSGGEGCREGYILSPLGRYTGRKLGGAACCLVSTLSPQSRSHQYETYLHKYYVDLAFISELLSCR